MCSSISSIKSSEIHCHLITLLYRSKLFPVWKAINYFRPQRRGQCCLSLIFWIRLEVFRALIQPIIPLWGCFLSLGEHLMFYDNTLSKEKKKIYCKYLGVSQRQYLCGFSKWLWQASSHNDCTITNTKPTVPRAVEQELCSCIINPIYCWNSFRD